MQKTISIIIPGYNEGKIIVGTIKRVEKTLNAMDKSYEILIVDDGSTDSTTQILEKLVKSKEHPNLKFVSYKDGPSRRENLAKSFRFLRGYYIILLDMDLALDLKHLKDMLYWLEDGYEIVIPNRYNKKSHIKRYIGRYIISKLYNTFIRILFRTGFKDNICGFKAFKKNVILKLIKETGIDKTISVTGILTSGSSTYASYTVTTGKTLYITTVALIGGTETYALGGLTATCWVELFNQSLGATIFQLGGAGGAGLSLSRPAKFTSGQVLRLYIYNRAATSMDVAAWALGYEI